MPVSAGQETASATSASTGTSAPRLNRLSLPGPCGLIILTSCLVLILSLSLDVLRITDFVPTHPGDGTSELPTPPSDPSSDVTTPEKCRTLSHLPVLRGAAEPPPTKPLVSTLMSWLLSALSQDRGPEAQRTASCLQCTWRRSLQLARNKVVKLAFGENVPGSPPRVLFPPSLQALEFLAEKRTGGQSAPNLAQSG